MKIKKDDIPKKKSGPDRQLALTPQNEATAKKAKGRPFHPRISMKNSKKKTMCFLMSCPFLRLSWIYRMKT